MSLYLKSWTVVGYSYRADTYCPGHTVGQLTVNPGDVHHREHLFDNVESHLDSLARIFGVNRHDERTFDSDTFPKVIFADQADDDSCAVCKQPLLA